MDHSIRIIEAAPLQVLLISSAVLWLGMYLTQRIHFLNRFNIPASVTGGLICSTAIACAEVFLSIQVRFDLVLRDVLLLIFFSTIGLNANFRLLLAGGKSIAILTVAAAVFLVLQDLTGLLAASIFDSHSAFGLLAGSVSFAGGHGTGITYSQLFSESFQINGAMEFSMACATFGLIMGGIVGGPLAEFIIRKDKLAPPSDLITPETSVQNTPQDKLTDMNSVINATFVIAVCLGAGGAIHTSLQDLGATLPAYLPGLFVGIVITNVGSLLKISASENYKNAINLWSDISLTLFLAMSLMSLQLLGLSAALKPLATVLLLQVALIVLVAYFVVYRLMGRNYDAAVITSGFTGLGLGATPVGLANMRAVTEKFGPSPKAFLVIPLIGAFFIDLVNAMILQVFVKLIS